MLRLIYSLLLYLLAPVVFAVTALHGLRNASYRDRLIERFGFVHGAPGTSPIWIHAVSVGEVQASVAVVRALLREYPGRPILMTTATPTGAQRVKGLFGGAVRHSYLPYDLPGSVRRFLDRTQPAIALVMEREIWPNLFVECARRNIPLVLASARLSPTSPWRFSWSSRLIRNVLTDHAFIAAQTIDDAERFRAIGADSARTYVTGNVKFDIEIPGSIYDLGVSMRVQQFPQRPVWIAGSTHAGEEIAVLDAHAQIRRVHPDTLLILVPRHPPRFDEVRGLLTSRDWLFASRSKDEAISTHTSVLLIDTLGELVLFYAASDVVFVAGSLVPIGGHNLLEPAALGLPIIVGPHNFNAPDIARSMLSQGAAVEVTSAAQLAEVVSMLLNDPSRRQQMGERARSIVESNRGAVERLLKIVTPLMHSLERR